MAVKFSQFATATTTSTDTRLVGFDGTGAGIANKQLSLSLTGIYSTDGVLLANRTVTMSNFVLKLVGGPLNLIPAQSGTAFEIKNNPSTGSPVSMLKVDESGLFYIGKEAVATSAGDVVIGELASVTESTILNPSIAIGKNVEVEATDAVAIGNGSKVLGAGAISIGYSSQSSLASSITLNASGESATNAITKSFKVFMTNGTTPDFDVVAGGESTLNTSLKITGQGYTELHTASLPSGGTFTPNWDDSNVQTIVLQGDVEIVNPTSIKPGATYILILKQDTEGDHVVEFSGNKYKFPGGTAPTFTLTGGKADVVTLVAYSANILMCTSVLDFATS